MLAFRLALVQLVLEGHRWKKTMTARKLPGGGSTLLLWAREGSAPKLRLRRMRPRRFRRTSQIELLRIGLDAVQTEFERALAFCSVLRASQSLRSAIPASDASYITFRCIHAIARAFEASRARRF